MKTIIGLIMVLLLTTFSAFGDEATESDKEKKGTEVFLTPPPESNYLH